MWSTRRSIKINGLENFYHKNKKMGRVSSSSVTLQVHRGAFEMMACKDCLEEDIIEV